MVSETIRVRNTSPLPVPAWFHYPLQGAALDARILQGNSHLEMIFSRDPVYVCCSFRTASDGPGQVVVLEEARYEKGRNSGRAPDDRRALAGCRCVPATRRTA